MLLLVLVFVGSSLGLADEGMWTFDNPPLKLLKEKYGFTPTQAWLDHVRLSSVRFNDGGSGSFVSPPDWCSPIITSRAGSCKRFLRPRRITPPTGFTLARRPRN
jgi:hypothetical protein